MHEYKTNDGGSQQFFNNMCLQSLFFLLQYTNLYVMVVQ